MLAAKKKKKRLIERGLLDEQFSRRVFLLLKAKSEALPPHSMEDYIVQRGDTLAGIALQRGMELREIKSVNKLWGDAIWPGCVPFPLPRKPSERFLFPFSVLFGFLFVWRWTDGVVGGLRGLGKSSK